jgi:hypothetical protein
MAKTLERTKFFRVIFQVDDELCLLWHKIVSLDTIRINKFYLQALNNMAWVMIVKSFGW